ncbi:hypothetical protein DMC30DRAFT_356048 [Rhodotorula diobovata]|uniref:F-box domain-containing protein n=1 Tax=Rhodotorula diobovata TaxID=5288 RepID=A0A5C5FQB4_9BASI|nr:hypothetical protein DMC30DRAFT_356048 [Rhodotorula diobovata]
MASPSQSPSPQAHAADDTVRARDSLPDELWFQILDELDYEGLHKAARLCKKVKAFIQDERFDDVLFRTKPPKKLPANSRVEIHPLLQATYCVFTKKDALTWASMGSDDSSEHTAFEYPAVDEFATVPACGIMNIDVGIGKKFPVTDRNGVKVRRLLQRLGHFWGQKPPAWMAYRIHGEYDVGPDEVTWQMMLGDRCGWTGWASAVVENEGKAVTLTADGYDS